MRGPHIDVAALARVREHLSRYVDETVANRHLQVEGEAGSDESDQTGTVAPSCADG
ncbi:hypothetical protein [Nonomuraea rhizosphaerae]|uniref:hypothetical protein n=1 Tax=Nonomuraea rhizosphaerae TaxID=2665663 RepID=UPI001C5DA2F0|nr:hypothetical protein [Nonomuraea rhizosphaerae]